MILGLHQFIHMGLSWFMQNEIWMIKYQDDPNLLPLFQHFTTQVQPLIYNLWYIPLPQISSLLQTHHCCQLVVCRLITIHCQWLHHLHLPSPHASMQLLNGKLSLKCHKKGEAMRHPHTTNRHHQRSLHQTLTHCQVIKIKSCLVKIKMNGWQKKREFYLFFQCKVSF